MTLVNFQEKIKANAINASYYNNVLDSLFKDVEAKNNSYEKLPAVNISESEQNFTIDLAAPGMKREDFQINLKKDILTVTVDKKKEDGEGKKQFSRKEFDFGNFSRSFNMPENADSEKIAASYANGILSLTIDKRDEKYLQREISVS